MKKDKISFKKRCWMFMDKHPNLVVFLDTLDAANNKLVTVYTIFLAIFMIGLPVAVVYFTLPAAIRGEISTITGTLLTVVVMPFVINNYNRKKDGIDKRFEKNRMLYEKLAENLVVVLTHQEDRQGNKKRLQKYIKEFYPQMCLSFSATLISNLYSVYRGCINGNYNNVKYFGEKCLVLIRKEGGVGKQFYLSTMILEAIQEKSDEETLQKQ